MSLSKGTTIYALLSINKWDERKAGSINALESIS